MSTPAQHDAARTRARERLLGLTGASVRALSGRPGLHYRGRDLYDGTVPLPVPAAHLHPDPDTAVSGSFRGLADAVALRLTLSDPGLHQHLRPTDPVARAVFELLEQFRVESLAPATAPGMTTNLGRRFTAWSDEFLASGLAETTHGMLAFTLAHLCRSRILAAPIPGPVEDLLEETRFALAGRLGEALGLLRGLRRDQQAFAAPATQIAELTAELITQNQDETGGRDRTGGWAGFLLEEQDTDDDQHEPAQARPGRSCVLQEHHHRYRVYTTDYDRTLAATALVRPARLQQLRAELDRCLQQARLNPQRLGARLARLLGQPAQHGWHHGQEEGTLDSARLARLISTPSDTEIFRTHRQVPALDLSVTFLLDCSGSMAGHNQAVAVLVDTFCRALDLAQAQTEVLGFTTGSWNGGRAHQQWRRAGAPPAPGRLAERRHLILKPATSTWRRSRTGIAALLKNDLYREGLDGEALDWACTRATTNPTTGPHTRRIVVVITDGSPSETTTTLVNDPDYLGHHLRQVVDQHTTGGAVEILALGLGLDLSPYYNRCRTVDLTHGTTEETLTELTTLLTPHHPHP